LVIVGADGGVVSVTGSVADDSLSADPALLVAITVTVIRDP
jgi:hypothetical protein